MPVVNSAPPHRSVLRETPFALFWCARVASAIAFQMQAVAVGWQAYALTGSAFYLGLVGLAQFLPMFLLTLVVGHVADRFDRRKVARICQVTEGLAAGALAIGSAYGWLGKEWILAIAFIAGAARAFEGPAMQAMVPGLVPALLIPQAVAWSAAALQVASILGPAIGGLLYAFGPTTVYVTTSCLFLTAGSCIALIRTAPALPRLREPISLQSLLAAARKLLSRRRCLTASASRSSPGPT